MGAVAPLAIDALLVRLRQLNRVLAAAVDDRARRTARLQRSGAAAFLSDEHAVALLGDVATASGGGSGAWAPTPEDEADLAVLRANAKALGVRLPLDELADVLALDEDDVRCVVTCAAVEVDSAYERIFGYVLDDLTRGRPSVELLSQLLAREPRERLALRSALGPFAPLRLQGVLVAVGESATETRQELRLGLGLLAYLLGEPVELGSVVGDRAEVVVPDLVALPPGVDAGHVRRLGRGVAARTVSIVGVWGRDDAARADVALAFARTAGRPLRRLNAVELAAGRIDTRAAVADAMRAAQALRALLWLETDALAEEEHAALARIVESEAIASAVPLCLSGRAPWRPASLIAARVYADVELDSPTYGERRRLWQGVLPELDRATADDLAARFRIGTGEMRAAAAIARAGVALSGNGTHVRDTIASACSTVARRESYRFATLVKPRRTPDDLVVPDALHRQVLEIAAFFRHWPRISEEWALERTASGHGFRALFTGEPGTGKTLAAEVIAGLLGLDLLKVDLGRVVSKWVGETERQLEVAFDEAEDSACVLFFDEADALFAKRGEIRHGTDRYANLEVGYLLQRLEAFGGLVVLATNLRENVDDAFTRRFNAILHFPRPATVERRRIWELALPPQAPAPSVDLDVLSGLDLTGAGIVATAHTAALLAADDGTNEITMRHALQAAARQFRREGRVLAPAQLGEHAALL